MRATHQRFVHGSVHPRRDPEASNGLSSPSFRGRHRADVEAPKRPVYVRSVLPRNVASPAKRQIAGQKFAFSQMLGRERAARDDDGERESASLYGPVRDTRDTANVRVFVGFGNTVPLGSYLPYIRPSRLRARPRRDGCHPLPFRVRRRARAETAKRDFFRGVVSRRFARRALALRLFPAPHAARARSVRGDRRAPEPRGERLERIAALVRHRGERAARRTARRARRQASERAARVPPPSSARAAEPSQRRRGVRCRSARSSSFREEEVFYAGSASSATRSGARALARPPRSKG